VWAVELGRGSSLADLQGTLALEAEVLSFDPREEGRPARRIRFADIRKVKRLRGSPVLLVVHADQGGIAQTAFYFIQPPPLDPPVRTTTSPFSFGRSSKRKERRRNVGYLTASNQRKKEELRAWEAALRTAMQGPATAS
jgi:hypothetical protein